jgi:hypothetical protein
MKVMKITTVYSRKTMPFIFKLFEKCRRWTIKVSVYYCYTLQIEPNRYVSTCYFERESSIPDPFYIFLRLAALLNIQ